MSASHQHQPIGIGARHPHNGAEVRNGRNGWVLLAATRRAWLYMKR
jgi:hypothetical protein